MQFDYRFILCLILVLMVSYNFGYCDRKAIKSQEIHSHFKFLLMV